jgi:carbon monoxide dehydrogenase subunit G
MQVTGERILPVDRGRAWSALTDPAVLRAAIPGCEAFDRTEEGHYRVVMAAAVGPVKARFTGRVVLEDVVVAQSYRLRFEGEGKAAGFARGAAQVRLQDHEGGGTRLDYDAEAQVGGRIAQVGSRLVDPAARKFVESFFTSFCELLTAEERSVP